MDLNRRHLIGAVGAAGALAVSADAARAAPLTSALGRDVTLYPGTILQGTTSIGDGTELGPDTRLVDCMVGAGCIAGALLVGLLTAKTFVDWQAIQFYRAEWLLAATASFVAGILLKKSSNRDSE